MKTIRVGFSHHPASVFSRLIQVATASEVSHSYIRLPVPEYLTDVIFQASGLSVNYVSREVFESKNVVVEEYDVEVSDEQWRKAEEFRVTEVGKSYSMKQIFGFVLVLGMRQIGRRVPNPFGNGNHAYVCCEVVASCIGLPDGEAMTPEDLRRYCQRTAKRVR